MINVAGLVASCALMACCSGGGEGNIAAGTQSVPSSTPTTGVASVSSEAGSGAGSAADGDVAAEEVASAPTVIAAAARVGESAKTSVAESSSTTETASTGGATGATANTGNTAGAATAPPPAQAKILNTAVASAALEANIAAVPGAETAAAAPVPCNLDLTRSFGAACFAAVTAKLADGASASIPNAKPGYRGSTQASCKNGTVSWSNETCTAATLLSSAAAGVKQAVKGLQAAAAPAAASADYQIGVYYFGGWKDKQPGAPSVTPWASIKRYPDREPLLGRYAEDGVGVMSQQLKWMRQYGIDFVVFNWYWSRDNTPVLEQAVKAYLATSNKPAVKFAVQWSNHEAYNYTRDQLDAMFRYWVNNYFKRPEYQLYNGKPAVYIFMAPNWARNAAAIGLSSAGLVERLNTIAKAAGLPGVSVIAGLWGGDKSLDYSESSGFAAFTAYNYQSPASISLQPYRAGNYSHSYAELHQSYANQWDWMIKNTNQKFIVPMSSGWDKRPWGGSTDPLHDDSRSLPSEFALHLQAAKSFMDANATRTQRTGIVCCWNEYGEGSFIEPTKVDQFNYLQMIGSTFGTK